MVFRVGSTTCSSACFTSFPVFPFVWSPLFSALVLTILLFRRLHVHSSTHAWTIVLFPHPQLICRRLSGTVYNLGSCSTDSLLFPCTFFSNHTHSSYNSAYSSFLRFFPVIPACFQLPYCFKSLIMRGIHTSLYAQFQCTLKTSDMPRCAAL